MTKKKKSAPKNKKILLFARLFGQSWRLRLRLRLRLLILILVLFCPGGRLGAGGRRQLAAAFAGNFLKHFLCVGSNLHERASADERQHLLPVLAVEHDALQKQLVFLRSPATEDIRNMLRWQSRLLKAFYESDKHNQIIIMQIILMQLSKKLC